MIPKSKLKSLVGKKIWYVEEVDEYCDCPHCEGCGDPEEAVQVKVAEVDVSDEYIPIKVDLEYGTTRPNPSRCFLTKKEALAFIKKNGGE